jgi:site-specific recombinase XerD
VPQAIDPTALACVPSSFCCGALGYGSAKRSSWPRPTSTPLAAVIVRKGKGGRRREVGMDRWAWSQLESWRETRSELPVGAFLCVIHGPTAGRRWDPSAARKQLRVSAAAAGVRRRFARHQLRHAHAVEMAHEGVPLVVIQRQLGHVNLGITSIYLQGIDSSEIIETVHARPAPVISATAGLRPNP